MNRQPVPLNGITMTPAAESRQHDGCEKNYAASGGGVNTSSHGKTGNETSLIRAHAFNLESRLFKGRYRKISAALTISA
jgi:hypothetical protein